MFRLTKRLKFDASHVIPGHPGKCANLHGHTWFVDIEVTGGELDAIGILVDFSDLKQLEALLPDHRHLNDVLDVSPTAENLARHLYREFRQRVPQVSAVTVSEGPNSWCRYEEDPVR